MYVVIYRAACERVAGSYKIRENNPRLGFLSPSTPCVESPTWLHPPGSKQFAEKEYFCC